MCERRYYSSNVSSDICRLTNVPLLPCSCFINVRDVSLAPQSLVQCFVQQYYFLKLHEWVSYPRGACIYVSVLIILHFSPLLWYGRTYSAVRSEVAQSCVTLCNLMDCSLTGSFVHGILQARILEWVAIPFSRLSFQPRNQTWISCIAGSEPPVQFSSVPSLSRVRLFATPWIAARQVTLSITNSWSSLRLTSIESVMPSSHLILCRPLLLLPPTPPSIRVFSRESTFRMRWTKYWSFSFSIIPSKEIPGLISFRMDWLDLLALQGTL